MLKPMKYLGAAASATCLAFIILLLIPLGARAGSYAEDFTTTGSCDSVNTTACWDTVCCTLGLPPFELTSAGEIQTTDMAYGVTICGDYAYVGAYSSGLYIVDISDPDNPTLAANYATPDYANNVAISGDHAYVADWASGLQVINISDPTNPTYAGSYDTGSAIDVIVWGNHAYVGGHGSLRQLQLIDITDPTNPTLASSYDTAGPVRITRVSGDYAYVAETDSGLEVVDISDPLNPTFAGRCTTPGVARGLDVLGDYAYIGDDVVGLQVIDISVPTNPVIVGTCPLPSNARRVAACGDYVYVANHLGGLQVVDVSDPINPAVVGMFDTPSHSHGVAIAGEFACVADWAGGLQVVHIADPLLPPLLVGSCDTPGDARDVMLYGDYAYVADGASGLQVIGLLDPDDPLPAGSYDTPGTAKGVTVEGNYAYVADGGSGLQIVDVSVPASPSFTAAYDTPGDAQGTVIWGDHAYVVDGAYGLWVIDITDPTSPAPAGSCDTPGSAGGIVIEGPYAYVADGASGVHSIDITDPTNPALGATCDTPGDAHKICISGDYAFVADGDSGLQVIDIHDPTTPMLATSYPTPGSSQAVAFCGDLLYVADGDSGVVVFDITDPVNPTLICLYQAVDQAAGIAVSGDWAGVADGTSGFQVLEILQRRFKTQANVGQSVAIDEHEDVITRVRLSACQADSVRWQVSTDSGSTWEEIPSDGTWHAPAVAGDDLVWRSLHAYAGGWSNPACSHLEIDWLYEFPEIGSVTDIPGDQGKQVSLSWMRSEHDYVGSDIPIVEYAVYRRIDYDLSGPSEYDLAAGPGVSSHQPMEAPEPHRLYPPGDWHFITTVPACAEDQYAVVAPTLADSTIVEGMCYTVFFVRALTDTPGIHFDSYPDSGYSVDNLAPFAPPNLRIEWPTDLVWDESEAEDFDYFTVYGSSAPQLDETATTIGYTIETQMDVEGYEYGYFHVTATDFAGNEGEASSVENTCSGVPIAQDLPSVYALRQNSPNPFSGGTVIDFDIPRPGVVRLDVFDARGRLVRNLTDRVWVAGRHSLVWRGDNGAGEMCGCGIYLVRIKAADFTDTKKILLVK